MAIIFGMRSDSATFNARYSGAGLTPALMYSNAANIPVYTVDATAIGGTNYSLDRGASQQAAILYPAKGIFTNQAISVLMRIKFSAVATYGLMEIASGSGWVMNQFLFYMVSDWRLSMVNQTPATICSAAILYATPPSTGVWYDVVITWDGTTTANAIKLWIDGTNVGSATGLATASNPRDSKRTSYISIGGVPGASNTRFVINECVIWDSVIDPTSVTLTSGTGSLQGAARTAFVEVSSYDGSSYSDPGVANVKTGTAYTVAGVSYTGTYTGSDRWSDPGVANVKKDVAYKADSTTNNRTGTLISTGGVGGFNGFGG